MKYLKIIYKTQDVFAFTQVKLFSWAFFLSGILSSILSSLG